MAPQRTLQKNAADPEQVKFAGRKQKNREDRFLDALRIVMGTPSGRIVMWELLARAGIFRSIWDSSAKIHYNAGRQDYGHELLANLTGTRHDEDRYQLMEREMRAWERGEADEAAAVQTPAATEGEESA